jgi:hypothetical protein
VIKEFSFNWFLASTAMSLSGFSFAITYLFVRNIFFEPFFRTSIFVQKGIFFYSPVYAITFQSLKNSNKTILGNLERQLYLVKIPIVHTKKHNI